MFKVSYPVIPLEVKIINIKFLSQNQTLLEHFLNFNIKIFKLQNVVKFNNFFAI